MIYDYQIKQEEQKEILYLYFEFADDFARFKNSKKYSLKDTIKDYIKKSNIFFKGATVAIVIGGIVVGTIILNEPNNELIYMNDLVKVKEILKVNEVPKNVENIKIKDISNGEVIQKKEETKVKVDKQKEKISKDEKTKENTKKTTIVKKEEKMEEKKESVGNIKSEEEKKETLASKIMVQVNRRNGTVLNLELETYVIGVVGAEMPASFDIEALKAQAVIARTYALNALNKGIKLTDDSSTQNYKNDEELKSMWGSSYNTYYNKIKTAVSSTKGEYLTYKGEIIDAVYHSTSNGLTESARFVWGVEKPYLVSVESPYDKTNSSFIKETFFSYDELTKKMGIDINFETLFNITEYTDGNRIANIEILGNNYTGVQIRNVLGLRAADFEIKKQEDGIIFKTKGYGHGVGMSQYGANGYAKSGYSYKKILLHYYTGVELTKIS